MSKDMAQFMDAYVSEVEEHLENLNFCLLKLENEPENSEIINQLFRSAHTLKSSSAAMGFTKISELAHSMEDVLGRLKNKELKASKEIVNILLRCFDALEDMINKVTKGEKEDLNTTQLVVGLKKIMALKQGENLEINENELGETKKKDSSSKIHFIKVPIERLDKLMNLVGELLITKMRFQQIKIQNKLEVLNEPLNELDHLIDNIQFEVMESRLIPIGQIFTRFPRMVRDIADKEGKKINFDIKGNDIELDRSVLDKLADPLVHILRNAVDHGIESKEQRLKSNKKEEGIIKLLARKEKNAVIIEIEDDGGGFDLEQIKQVAVKRNIVSQDEINRMPENKIMMLPFDPNFSTSKKVTEVSGRGVGLDVVNKMVGELNGTIKIESKKGKSSKFILELPLTLAILKCFLIKVGKETYGIPLTNVSRCVQVQQKKIKTIEGHESFVIDEEDLPLLRLKQMFNMESNDPENLTAVVVEKSGDKAGLVVDKILGEQELIIKPLEKSLRKTKGFSGAAILGDGNVALILDINTLI